MRRQFENLARVAHTWAEDRPLHEQAPEWLALERAMRRRARAVTRTRLLGGAALGVAAVAAVLFVRGGAPSRPPAVLRRVGRGRRVPGDGRPGSLRRGARAGDVLRRLRRGAAAGRAWPRSRHDRGGRARETGGGACPVRHRPPPQDRMVGGGGALHRRRARDGVRGGLVGRQRRAGGGPDVGLGQCPWARGGRVRSSCARDRD